MVVVLHPQAQPLPRRFERVKLGPHQKLLPHRRPEPLHLPQGHRVLRPRHDVRHPVLLEFRREAALAPPARVLPPPVGQHLLRRGVFPGRHPVRLDHRLRRRAAVQVQPDHVARVIVQERHHVGVLAAQPEREQIALPHLVRARPLEEPRPGQVPPGFRRPVHQPRFLQPAPDRLRAGRQEEQPAQGVGDPLHPVPAVRPLQLEDLLRHGRGQTAPRPGRRLPLQSGLPVRPVIPQPRGQRARAHARFLADQLVAEPFLEDQPHGPQSHLKRVATLLLLSGPRFAGPLLFD